MAIVALSVLPGPVASGGGSISPSSSATDATNTLGNTAETNTYTASASGLTGQTQTFTTSSTASWSGSVTLNFDSISGSGCVDATSYLSGFGVTVSQASAGSTVSIGAPGGCVHSDVVPSSPPNILTVPNNSPVSFTLNFDRPLSSVSFSRVRLNAGSSGVNHVGWSATAYSATNGAGTQLAQVSEGALFAGNFIAAASFTLTGSGIRSVAFVRTNPSGTNTSFGVSFAVLDNFVLAEPTSPPALAEQPPPITAVTQQQPPHRFGGTATRDGTPVAAGTAVTAVIDGKTVATATTAAGGNYVIDVVQPQGASYSGKTVTFNIGTAVATQTATWSLGGATILNLTAARGPRLSVSLVSLLPRALGEVVFGPTDRIGDVWKGRVQVSNTGDAPLTVTKAELSESIHLSHVGDECRGKTLGPGAACEVSVQVTVDAPGVFKFNLTVTTTAGNATLPLEVTGGRLYPPKLSNPQANELVQPRPSFRMDKLRGQPFNFRFRIEVLRDGRVAKSYDQTISSTGWSQDIHALTGEIFTGFGIPQQDELEPGVRYTWRAFVYHVPSRQWSGPSEERGLQVRGVPRPPPVPATPRFQASYVPRDFLPGREVRHELIIRNVGTAGGVGVFELMSPPGLELIGYEDSPGSRFQFAGQSLEFTVGPWGITIQKNLIAFSVELPPGGSATRTFRWRLPPDRVIFPGQETFCERRYRDPGDRFRECPPGRYSVHDRLDFQLCQRVAGVETPGGSRCSRASAEVNVEVQIRASFDPNDMLASPPGAGEKNFIRGEETIAYLVRFENVAAATAEAQDVKVTAFLDKNLDLTTVQLGLTSVDDRSDVTITTEVDPEKGTIAWVLGNINLPPNKKPPEGEGWVKFQVRPKAGLPTGTRMESWARIVFDFNPPIDTPKVQHTIDADPPTTRLEPLPAVVDQSTFTLRWTGADGQGSGVGALTLLASENGRPFEVATVAADQEVKFTGKAGSTYRLLGAGTDLVGREEKAEGKEPLVVKVGREVPFPAGLQLMALPLAPEDLKGIGAQTKGKWAWWDGGTQQFRQLGEQEAWPDPERVPGQGFWLDLKELAQVFLTGQFVAGDKPFVVPLAKGWNLLGNPFPVPLPWSLEKTQVRSEGKTLSLREAQKAGWVEDFAWGWDGKKYFLVYDASAMPGAVSHLEPWRAYWVKAHRPVDMVLVP